MKCSRKEFDCDVCFKKIPVGSSYRHRQYMDVPNNKGVQLRWHDDCPMPEPLASWQRSAEERSQRHGVAVQKIRDRGAELKQRNATVRERLTALGLDIRHSFSAPGSVCMSLSNMEKLLDAVERVSNDAG